MTNDLISDLLTRIRNASNASLSTFIVPRTKVSISILHLLFVEGFISGYYIKNSKSIEVRIAYTYNKAIISQLKRISKPSNRVYWSVRSLKRIMKAEPLSFYILSTNQGIVSSTFASLYNVGGEVICKIV
jgi:small subunit ribosomal protein S8